MPEAPARQCAATVPHGAHSIQYDGEPLTRCPGLLSPEVPPVALAIAVPRGDADALAGDLLWAISAVRGSAGKATLAGDFPKAALLAARLNRLRALRGELRRAARAPGPDAHHTTSPKPGAA